MRTNQFTLDLHDELIVDEFAAGGGMSTAIEMAIGRHVDISVNHDDDACSMHQINHPQTEHFCADVFDVPPKTVTKGRPVGLLHMSPDCTDHSQAKGGQPRSRKLRALSWIGVRWAGQVRPRMMSLENVKQILKWGPLIAKRCTATGRVVKIDGTVAAPGERVPVQQQHLVPCPKRAGRTWLRFVALLRGMGYDVEWRVLRAADHDVPTKRSRLFMFARCDGAPIVWPEPSHHAKPAKGQKKWRPAAEAINFSIPSKSIFDRPRPLADATLRRIAYGMQRYVLGAAEPFIVPIANWSTQSVDSIQAPLRTITAWPKGGALSVVSPVMVQIAHGQGKPGGVQRWGKGCTSVQEPIGTVTASGGHAIAMAHLVATGYGERTGQAPRAMDITQPLGTVVGATKHALVTAFVEQANGGYNTTPAYDAREPLTTITTSGSQQRLVTAQLAQAQPEYQLSAEAEAGALRCAAFLIRYYGTGGQWGDLREPVATITTRDRLALVTVWIKGDPYVIVDICLRMLTPRELFNASSFPSDYIIDRGHDGRKFSLAKQVEMCGNAVPPNLGRAVIAANWNSRPAVRMAA